MLNERLKNLRLAKGLTLQQVGDVFGISKASISSWESGKSHPDHKRLEKLSALFGCSVQFLLTGEFEDHSISNSNLKVPFIEWNQIIDKESAELDSVYVSPLHSRPSKSSFATRYPASRNFLWQNCNIPAGSLLIIDPDEIPSPSDTLIIQLKNDQWALAQFAQTPENKKVLYRLDISEFKPISINSIKVLGVALEWQLSAKLR
jgi:transcriptional regulator with XRE-family HTH domain